MTCTKRVFGQIEGQDVFLYTLKNRAGSTVSITNLGGTVTSLTVPDRFGMPGDVVLGYSTLQEYLFDTCYFGCLIGRYANRIAGGRFSLDDSEHILAQNDPPNTLHGGINGFHRKVWDARSLADAHKSPGLELICQSPDGEEGFPGNLTVRVVYTLTESNELIVDYHAETDRQTIICLTNHSYFNLSGAETVLQHTLRLNASRYTPVNEVYIPTGEIRSVAGSCLDFREPMLIGAALEDERGLLLEGGLDHNFILDSSSGELVSAAVLSEAGSGRMLEVLTTEPALQVYTGNFLDGRVVGKMDTKYNKYGGICLETQHYPDSPNQPGFPSVILEPGERYHQKTLYRFSVMNN